MMDGFEGLSIDINGFKIQIHQSIVIWLVICLIATILLVWAGKQFKKADPTAMPNRRILVLDLIVHAGVGVIEGNLERDTKRFAPYVETILLLVILSNIMGVFGLQPPTSNVSVTLSLTILLLGLVHVEDIMTHGILAKLKSWLNPLQLLEDISLPISMTLRMFGNMLAGLIIMALLYLMIRELLPYSAFMFALTPFLHMYFDIFIAILQAYIFIMLASYFLGEAVHDDE